MEDAGGDREATRQLRMVTRVITDSPALLARERQVIGRYEEALAALLAEETGVAPEAAEPRAVANALLGVHRSLIGYVRVRTLAGATASEVAAEIRAQAEVAFERLEAGLGDYAVRS